MSESKDTAGGAAMAGGADRPAPMPSSPPPPLPSGGGKPAQGASPSSGSAEKQAPPAPQAAPPSPAPPAAHVAPPAPAKVPVEHRVWLSLIDLPGGKPVQIDILRACSAMWSHGTIIEVPIGFSLETDPRAGSFALRRFSITQKSLEFVPVDDLDLLVVRLFVLTEDTLVRGVVFLPDGARLTVETACDVTTVTGRGSFYIQVARPS